MRPDAIRCCLGFALALLLIATAAAMDSVALPAAPAEALAQAASPQAVAEYRRKLSEYQQARAAFEQEAAAYWSSIAEKRRARNAKRREHLAIGLEDYVLTQPPVYSGPKRPVNPEPSPVEPEPTRRERKYIPADRRPPEGGRRAFPIYAATAGQRAGVQARLCRVRHLQPG